MPHSILVAAEVMDSFDGYIPEPADGPSAIDGPAGPAGSFGRADGRPSYQPASGGRVSNAVGG